MNETQDIPLFPLNTVLFPRGKLSLQIFEQRYLDLVSRSLTEESGFGICLLKEGEEVARPGRKQIIHEVGTFGKIIDWDMLENGLLGITVEGLNKFEIKEYWLADNDLFMGRVKFCENDTAANARIPVEDDSSGMGQLLALLEQHPAVRELDLKIDYDNLWELGWRLSELIPVALEIKQELLELDDPWERIKVIEEAIHFLTYDA